MKMMTPDMKASKGPLTRPSWPPRRPPHLIGAVDSVAAVADEAGEGVGDAARQAGVGDAVALPGERAGGDVADVLLRLAAVAGGGVVGLALHQVGPGPAQQGQRRDQRQQQAHHLEMSVEEKRADRGGGTL